MPYEVSLKEEAKLDISRLQEKIRNQIGKKIDRLAHDFKPPKSELVQGMDGFRRIRSGDYRIIYSEPDSEGKISIFSVKNRDVVYKAYNR